MSSTSIRVSEEAKRQLDHHKREDESYDDVIRRLTTRDKWAGFGIAAGDAGDAREGMREVREAMREGVDGHISRD